MNAFSHLKTFVLAGLFVVWLAPFFSPLVAEESSSGFSLGEPLEKPTASDEKINKIPFHFDQKSWNDMRRIMEEGGELGVDPTEAVDVSTQTVEKPKAPPGQIRVELPYESSLSVTGRKVIKIELKNTTITSERAEELNTSQNTQSFDMEQELQARIQGTVARKTTINVNFDDTKDNVRDFSVVYKGDPDEVVQEAAFGDIVLSLPSTEFVNYNKQLFGIRAALKYKRAGLIAIGSRTKGNTETKRFTGTTTRQQVLVNDTDYIRRKFYDLRFTTSPAMISDAGAPLLNRPIIPINDSNPEIVYIEDTTGLNTQASDFEVAVPTAPNTSVILRMRQLSRGVDYSINRSSGVITFTNTINEDERVAIDFTLSDGTRLSSLVQGVAVLIKDRKPEAPNVSQEIRRFYSAKARNIVRDNNLGNFVFRVLKQDKETEFQLDDFSPEQRYPDTIDMDFEDGIFRLRERLDTNKPEFSDIYANNVTAGNPLHVVFSLEYQAIVRTYTLRPNIVLQSEIVEVDGRRVNRDLDYFIDYDIGIITFFNDDLIRESTVIEVTYEFAPFGGQLGETLVGARGTFDIFENKKILGMNLEKWSVGSTVLFNFASKPTAPPDIRSAPSSLLVTEGDTQIKGLQFGKIPIKTDFTFEKARSSEDPNLFGKALVDSFEGIKQEDSASLFEEAWQVGAAPVFTDSNGTYNTSVDFRGRENAASHLRWLDLDVPTFDTTDSANQKGLQISYELNTENSTIPEQVTMIQSLSRVGRDFSKKTGFEIELDGAGANGAGVDVIVEYGRFNEDADGDQTLDTEDQPPRDGILNLGEDIGFEYNGPGPDLTRETSDDAANVIQIGSGNTRFDTEDLNRDQALASTDLPATFTPIFSLSSTHTATTPQGSQEQISDLSFTGRRLVTVPFNVSSLTTEEQARLTSVQQIRITIRNTNGPATSRSGSFILARVSIVGISWDPAEIEPTSSGSTMTVTAINSKDDAGTYVTLIGNPAYNDLYQNSVPEITTREQALALAYDLVGDSTGTTRNTFGASRDLSEHEELRFFLRKRDADGACSPDCGIFFFQAGSETEFQQVSLPVSSIPRDSWLLVTLTQADLNKDGTPESWIAKTPGVTISRRGSVPALNQVSQLVAGVYNNLSTGSIISNQIWLNEIHMSDPNVRNGNAERISFDTTWDKWMTFGGSTREVDRLFQTPTTQVTNQDRTQETAYLNFDRLQFLPLTFKWSRDETITPSAFRSNANALVSFIEEGKVEKTNFSSTAKLQLAKFPVFDFSFSEDEDDNNVTQRNQVTRTMRAGVTYSPKSKPDLIPGKRLTLRPFPTSLSANHTIKETELRFPDNDTLVFFGVSTSPFSNSNLTQFSDTSDVRLSFIPWNGFTFNPRYELTVDRERRDFRQEEITAASQLSTINGFETPRKISQKISTSGSLRINKWFEPRYTYSVNGTETNDLPLLTAPTAYTEKTIVRNGSGELSATLQIQKIFDESKWLKKVVPTTKLFKTMTVNTSYKVENGDTYENVPESFSWRSKLWVGDPLNISSATGAQRTKLTDRRTFRNNVSWNPFTAYQIKNKRWRPLTNMSITSNFFTSTEDSETTGTSKRVESVTFPDLVVTINDTEDFFGIKRVIDASRLVLRTNTRKVETRSISKSQTDVYGTTYDFKLGLKQGWKKLDVSTSYDLNKSRDDNLVTNQLTSENQTQRYSFQIRLPFGSWSYTPRYERSQTDARDSARITNDTVNDIIQLQIYGDINRPFGLRFGRREIGFANRLILNSTLKWDRKRSNVNPQTNFLDIYSATLSGDYTLSKNFRLAIGGNFSHEAHHPDFDKLDKTTFAINSTLTIQF